MHGSHVVVYQVPHGISALHIHYSELIQSLSYRKSSGIEQEYST